MSEKVTTKVEKERAEPKHVRRFNEFMENSIHHEPESLAQLALLYPDLQFTFGSATTSYYYVVIKLNLDKNSSVRKDIPWHETPIADHNFVFTVEPNGSLTRLVYTVPTDSELPDPAPIASDLGKAKGKRFVKFVTNKESKRSYDIMDFLQLDDEALDQLAASHHELISTD